MADDIERALTLTDTSGDKIALTTEDQDTELVLVARITMHTKSDDDGVWVGLNEDQVAELVDFGGDELRRWRRDVKPA